MNTGRAFTRRILTGYWPFWTGGALLAILNILLAVFDKPWGISGNLAQWGLAVCKAAGGHPETWFYIWDEPLRLDFADLLFSRGTVLNLGLILGVMLAALLAAEFRIKKVKSPRQLALGIAGGLLMGYGARLALGCNIGGLVNGIASQSLHGWVFGLFLIFGAWAGSVFMKYIVSKNGS
ncbi:YeeE/YedE thiosulfate transporter family protein [Phosphitispora fastidiosa]|uniref:YeeE/YedE thiosulfate transporter family protein n=1 Tax=Phosphitispora fastidiosa TaxID=2837202 RepID=UPI001E5F45F9|nr:YeeE/YedE thiosulfate transporter family protein [Phosphitispora fastidiosa]MBU7006835.1 putative membrane protein YedE/YeeE [Phosphitispora fastidiosa]